MDLFIPPDSEERYVRQLCLPQFGLQEQLSLQQSHVTIIGAGALGCPVALYLAGAGVGRITVIDGDEIEMSNLHRQVAYSTLDIQHNKAESLISKLLLLNPENNYHAVAQHYNTSEAMVGYIQKASLVMDCSDNFETHFQVSDDCRKYSIPLVLGSVFQYQGQVMSFIPTHGPCYRCLYNQLEHDDLPICSESGVLGPVTGVIGSLMAGEAITILAQRHAVTANRLLYYDYQTQSTKLFTRTAEADCQCVEKLC